AVWILAAGAVTDGLRRVRAARAGWPRATTAGGWLIAATALVGLGQLPLRPDPGNLRTSWVNLALVEMGEARVAIEAAPSDADARWALVLALDLSTPLLPARREDGDVEAVRCLLVLEAER